MGNKLKVLDLFSGIGGFSLGLERTGGFETVAFCEIDGHAQKVLKKNYPNIPIYEDVVNLKHEGQVDVITGGFPCQDVSVAGKKAGLQGDRSGLWGHMVRIIGELRPSYVIIENVANLLVGPTEHRGGWFRTILTDLADIGYDAQWHIIPASAVGAGHHRKRVWIIAYPNQVRWDVPETIFNQLTFQISQIRTPRSVMALLNRFKRISIDQTYPDHRKLDGLSDAVDGLERLGNSIHPKIPEIIGHAILQAEAA